MTQLHKSINGSLCPTAILLIVTVGSLSSGVLNALFLRSLWTNPHKNSQNLANFDITAQTRNDYCTCDTSGKISAHAPYIFVRVEEIRALSPIILPLQTKLIRVFSL